MKLLVGLGNPGEKYAGNRHNVGFMAIDEIASQYNAGSFKDKFQGKVAEIKIGAEKVLLLKPQTYMNDSGRSVQAALKFYKIKPENIIVFYDELDLSPFKVKAKYAGGTGGHNGIKSLDAHLPSKNYMRVRIGIGHPGSKEKVTPYVLSDFAKSERQSLEDFIYYNAKELPLLLENNMNDYMTHMAERIKK